MTLNGLRVLKKSKSTSNMREAVGGRVRLGVLTHGYDDEDRPSPSLGKACPIDEELFSQSQMNELVWL